MQAVFKAVASFKGRKKKRKNSAIINPILTDNSLGGLTREFFFWYILIDKFLKKPIWHRKLQVTHPVSPPLPRTSRGDKPKPAETKYIAWARERAKCEERKVSMWKEWAKKRSNSKSWDYRVRDVRKRAEEYNERFYLSSVRWQKEASWGKLNVTILTKPQKVREVKQSCQGSAPCWVACSWHRPRMSSLHSPHYWHLIPYRSIGNK